MANDIQPLQDRVQIVNANGTPTPFFIRWAKQRQIDINEGITAAQAQQLIEDWAAARDIVAGIGLDGGGNLSADITINLEDTAVTPDTYGDASNIPQITVDQQGRITNIVDIPAAGGGGSLEIEDEGVSVETGVTKINFTGPGVTATSPAVGEVDVDIVGSSTPCPAIRTSAIQANASVATYVVNLPAGSAAGDFCVIFHSGGFGDASITSPAKATWDTYRQGAANWSGTIFSKILTAADVAAGSVTVTPVGTFNSVAAIVVFQGRAQFRNEIVELAARTIAVHAPGAGAAASTQDSIDTSTDDCVLVFVSNRANSANTSSYGTLLQTVSAANGSGALYANETPAAGGQTTNLAYSVAGTGRYELMLVIRGPI